MKQELLLFERELICLQREKQDKKLYQRYRFEIDSQIQLLECVIQTNRIVKETV